MGRQAVDLARASLGLSAHHGHAGAIEFEIEHGNGGTDREGQIQLPGAMDFRLLAGGDVGADGLRSAFDRFGGDL